MPNTDPSLSDAQVVRQVYPEAVQNRSFLSPYRFLVYDGDMRHGMHPPILGTSEESLKGAWADARSKLPAAVSKPSIIPVLDAEPKPDIRLDKPSEAKAKLTTEGRTGTANVPTGTKSAAVSEVDGGTEIEEELPFGHCNYENCSLGNGHIGGCNEDEAELRETIRDLRAQVLAAKAVAPQGTVEGETCTCWDYACPKFHQHETNATTYWKNEYKRMAESVAPPSVAMQECSAITAGWDKCSYCDDGLYEEWLIQQWPDEEERRHESHVHGSKMRLAWEAGRRCAASKAALPVAVSGEGSGVPTSENDRLCRAYLDLAAAYAERNQLKIELDELKAALSSPLPSDRLTAAQWRNEAFETCAVIAERYEQPFAAADMRAMKSATPVPKVVSSPLHICNTPKEKP